MLRDFLQKERSYRSFDPCYNVSFETLFDIVDCVRFTPSAMNAQALRFRLCYKKEECAKLLSLTKWAAALPQYHFPPEGHEPPAYIVICAEKDTFLRDVGIAAQTMMLAAVELGLGGCMIGNFDPEKVCDALGIAKELKPRLILGLGKPDETVILEDVVDGKTSYYRDEHFVHHVPKRKTEDMIL